MAFAMAAEIERDLISQRTAEALAIRKQQGMALGRPKGVGKSKLDAHQVEITALLKNGATKTWIAKKYGTTRRNLSHWMKQHRVAIESKD
jgi:DNA invertase Pin-like site-specific DNA recombinase